MVVAKKHPIKSYQILSSAESAPPIKSYKILQNPITTLSYLQLSPNKKRVPNPKVEHTLYLLLKLT